MAYIAGPAIREGAPSIRGCGIAIRSLRNLGNDACSSKSAYSWSTDKCDGLESCRDTGEKDRQPLRAWS
jgi:hypothetical protein